MEFWHGAINQKKLLNYKQKAIRTVTNSKYNSHTEPLFKEISCLKFDNLLDLNLLKFYYCYSNQLLPSYFDCFNFIKRSSVHFYNTRNRNLLCTQRTVTKSADNCVRHAAPKLLIIQIL